MDTQPTTKIKKERSAAYPSIDLEKAIKNINTIKANIGSGPFSRLSAAQALGYAGINGKSATTTAALVQYGLLARTGDTYTVSTLSEEITAYRDEAEKNSAIVKAAQHPKLYGELIKAYGGRSLPAMLEHILTRDHRIKAKVAPEVSKTFISSMTFAGLLVNGVLASAGISSKASTGSEEHSNAMTEPLVRPHSVDDGPRIADDGKMQQFDIKAGVTLSIPSERVLELFMNSKFTTAVSDLRAAIGKEDPVPPQNDLERNDGQSE